MLKAVRHDEERIKQKMMNNMPNTIEVDNMMNRANNAMIDSMTTGQHNHIISYETVHLTACLDLPLQWTQGQRRWHGVKTAQLPSDGTQASSLPLESCNPCKRKSACKV